MLRIFKNNVRSVLAGICCVVVVCLEVGVVENVSGMYQDSTIMSLEELSASKQLHTQVVGSSFNDTSDNEIAEPSSVIDIAREFCENLQWPTKETMSFLESIPEFTEYENKIPSLLFNDIARDKNEGKVRAAMSIEAATGSIIIGGGIGNLVDEITKRSTSDYDALVKLSEAFLNFSYDDQILAMATFTQYATWPTVKEVKNGWATYPDPFAMATADCLHDYFFLQLLDQQMLR
jgi:hypothetical protein